MKRPAHRICAVAVGLTLCAGVITLARPPASSERSRLVGAGPITTADIKGTSTAPVVLPFRHVASRSYKRKPLTYDPFRGLPKVTEAPTPSVAPTPTKRVVEPKSIPEAPKPATTHRTTQPEPTKSRTSSPSRSYPAEAAGVWDKLAQCESSGNWASNTGNGFYGGIQFTISSWHAVGGSGLPSNASREEQIMRGKLLLARQGWGAWPACSRKLGLR